MASLNKLILIKFTEDTMVVPSESSWFGFFAINSTQDIIPMRDQPLYKQVNANSNVLVTVNGRIGLV